MSKKRKNKEVQPKVKHIAVGYRGFILYTKKEQRKKKEERIMLDGLRDGGHKNMKRNLSDRPPVIVVIILFPSR